MSSGKEVLYRAFLVGVIGASMAVATAGCKGDNSPLGPQYPNACAGGKPPDIDGRIGCWQIFPEPGQQAQPPAQSPRSQPPQGQYHPDPSDRPFRPQQASPDGKCPPGTSRRWFTNDCY